MKLGKFTLLLCAVGLLVLAGYFLLQNFFHPVRYLKTIEWLRNPESHPDWAMAAGTTCADAPFRMPTEGMIGFLWGDHFRIGHTHQGIDIFGGKQPGVTPVYAAFDGYLSRARDWKSSLIIRVPQDPLQPGRQIWTYYTHLADKDGTSFISKQFPPGSAEVQVTAGTLLGYQGNFSGTANNPVGVHLHFSIVKDDGSGKYLNELEYDNTLDPSPYLGLVLNAKTNRDTIPLCPPSPAP
jgi:murein DD-endopeptidase MepM/ murein hydrolase activator NlpD